MITLTEEQAQQIEEALDELRYANNTDIAKTKYYKALSTIRAARAKADHIAASVKPIAEQEPVGEVVSYHQAGLYDELPIGTKLYASPVRTKDLTDDEIGEIYEKHHALGGCWTDGFAYERAVIAADREKNNV